MQRCGCNCCLPAVSPFYSGDDALSFSPFLPLSPPYYISFFHVCRAFIVSEDRDNDSNRKGMSCVPAMSAAMCFINGVKIRILDSELYLPANRSL